MSRILDPRLVFNSIKKIHPDTEDFLEDEYIDTEMVNLEGGILVEIFALSLDLYTRNRMRPVQEPGDTPAFVLNDKRTVRCLPRPLLSRHIISVTGFGVGLI